MHREDYKILTQRKPGECHQETTVVLDWSGMTLEDYQLMAKAQLVHKLQTRWQKAGNEKIPEIIFINVREECHRAPIVTKVMPRKPKVEDTFADTADDKLDKLLKALKPEELAALMGDLANVEP